jgi:AcrR family transcriptional regulator
VFARRGYTAASIEEIASGAGIAKSVVYDHFESKRTLCLELLAVHGRALIEHATGPVQSVEDPEGAFRGTVERFLSWTHQHPFAWRLLFRDVAVDVELGNAAEEIQRAATKAISARIAHAPRLALSVALDRELANELLAETIKTAVNGVAAWWYEHQEIPLETVQEITMDVLWRGTAKIATGEVAAASGRE